MKNLKNQRLPMMKISLLSISLILATSLSVSSVVPKWSSAFPNFSHSSIEMLVTIPSLAVIFLLFFTDQIANRLGEKRMLIIGLLTYGIFGISPLIINNYWLLLFSRIMLGIGLGLTNGLAVSLIGTFFEGNVKNRLMGFRSGFEMLGNAFCSYLAVFLLVIANWHMIFLVYGIAFPILVLIWKYLPNIEKVKEGSKNEHTKEVNLSLIVMSIVIALYQITYVGSTVRISEFVISHQIGTVNDAAFIISIAPFAGLLGGLFFGRLFYGLKNYIFTITLITSGIFQLVVANSKNLMTASIGMFLITFLDAIFVAFILNQASRTNQKNTIHFNTSILLIGSNVGIFIAPIFLGFITNLFSLNDPVNSYLICGYALILAGLFSVYFLNEFKK